MSYENPTAIIDALKTMLLACPSFPGSADDVHYPAGPAGVDGPFPAFVLASGNLTGAKVADGLRSLPGGELQVIITDKTSIGEVEDLGRALLNELLEQDTLIPWQDGNVGMASAPDPGQLAAAEDASAPKIYTVVINLSFGLR